MRITITIEHDDDNTDVPELVKTEILTVSHGARREPLTISRNTPNGRLHLGFDCNTFWGNQGAPTDHWWWTPKIATVEEAIGRTLCKRCFPHGATVGSES